MIVFYERAERKHRTPRRRRREGASAATSGGTSLKRVEAKGGVSVISKDQVATGNEGVFDRASNKIILTGNVALSQGENVTKGEKLVYDTETGVALVESGATAGVPGGRVRGVFVPGDGREGQEAARRTARPSRPSRKASPAHPSPPPASVERSHCSAGGNDYPPGAPKMVGVPLGRCWTGASPSRGST